MQSKPNCKEEGCDKPHYARGWCFNHYHNDYMKWKRTGKARPAPPMLPGPVIPENIESQSKRAIPRTFLEYLEWATIESDLGYGTVLFNPWDFQKERAEAWDAGTSEVILKRRQAGLSWLAVHYCLYCAMFKRGHQAVLSAGQREADEFIRKMTAMWMKLPENWKMNWKGTSPVKFENGNIVQALPSTEDAGISFTFARLFVDEGAAHPYGAANYAQYRAAVANGQYLLFSAANPKLGPSGFFYDMWRGAIEGNNNYTPVFIPRNARPDQDEKWMAKERRSYAGQPEVFDVLYPEKWQQAFVGKTGLVLPEFSEQLHVAPAHPMPWEDYTYRFAAIDPGGGDPTAITPMGSWRDGRRGSVLYHQPHEFYSRQPVAIDGILGYLGLWHNRAPFTRIWVDTAGGEVLLNTLKQRGFPAFPAIKDRDAGLLVYRTVLAENRLTIHDSCKEGIAEFAGYRWLERPDPNSHERFRTGTPFDHHADAHDTRRYILLGAERAWGRMAAAEPAYRAGVPTPMQPRIKWVI
jgi:hypothetical protein